MEKHGYDVSYISNTDTHSDPKGLLRAKGFLSVGHDEYWSLEMFDHAIQARDAGVSLAFFGGILSYALYPCCHRLMALLTVISVGRDGFYRCGEYLSGRKKKLLSRSLNDKQFEPNMGPDGALLMGGRLDREGSGRGIGAGDWTCACQSIGCLRIPE